MWFWNYKIRIMKVLAKSMRDRPLSSLMVMGFGAPSMGIDTVWDGALTGAVLDGRVGFSVGPEMGINSPSLHPLFELAL